MKGNAPKLQNKTRKLLRLYSQWHETYQSDKRRACLSLLSEIVAAEPQFSLRREFDQAF